MEIGETYGLEKLKNISEASSITLLGLVLFSKHLAQRLLMEILTQVPE